MSKGPMQEGLQPQTTALVDEGHEWYNLMQALAYV